MFSVALHWLHWLHWLLSSDERNARLVAHPAVAVLIAGYCSSLA